MSLLPTPCRAEKVILTIEQSQRFTEIENQLVTPGEGRIFLGLLVAIKNTSDKIIDGGSEDPHATFRLETVNGYTIPAENTSSDAWRKNRMVWATQEIMPGEIKRGWLIFTIPKDDSPSQLIFDVAEKTGPYSSLLLGRNRIPVR